MVLKALYDYYQWSIEHNIPLPPYGFEDIEIAYTIVIDKNGCFKGLEKCGMTDDSKHYVTVWVPRGSERTSNVSAQLLWDDVRYVLGYEKNGINIESKYLKDFKERVDKLVAKFGNSTFRPVQSFYQNGEYHAVIKDPKNAELIKEISEQKLNLSFSILGAEHMIPSFLNEETREALMAYIQQEESNLDRGVCLVTGEQNVPIVRLTGMTPLLSATSGKLVSFQTKRGYDSYGYIQGKNAPISSRAEHAIYIALKTLLNRDEESTDNENRINIAMNPGAKAVIHGKKVKMGDKRAYVFWCSDNDSNIENDFAYLVSGPPPSVKDVKEGLMSFLNGQKSTDDKLRFFLLGVSPNGKARIAVNFWAEMTMRDATKRTIVFYENVKMQSIHEYVPNIKDIMNAASRPKEVQERKGNKWHIEYDYRDNLSEYLVKAIFFGQQLPFSLFHSCLQRFRLEPKPFKNVIVDERNFYERRDRVRAGVLKAYLNYDNNTSIHQQIFKPMLDKTNKSPGYLCGRLFAVLEWIQGAYSKAQTEQGKEKNEQMKQFEEKQEEKQARSNEYRSNIRERYIDAASSSPASVFPTLIRLSCHHSSTLQKKDYYDYESEKREIIDLFEDGLFPIQLNLKEQGAFFIGYYQQRKALFPPTKENTVMNTDINESEKL